MSLAVVFDYEMYIEVEEGEINQTWKEDNVFEFWTFYDLLSNKIIKYKQNHKKCSGGYNMRPDTQKNKDARYKRKDYVRGKIGRPLSEEVQLYKSAKKPKEAKYHQGTN